MISERVFRVGIPIEFHNFYWGDNSMADNATSVQAKGTVSNRSKCANDWNFSEFTQPSQRQWDFPSLSQQMEINEILAEKALNIAVILMEILSRPIRYPACEIPGGRKESVFLFRCVHEYRLIDLKVDAHSTSTYCSSELYCRPWWCRKVLVAILKYL